MIGYLLDLNEVASGLCRVTFVCHLEHFVAVLKLDKLLQCLPGILGKPFPLLFNRVF